MARSAAESPHTEEIMARKKLRVALIGCGGNMRGAHLPRFREDGQVVLVAVADPAADQAEALMDAWGGRVPQRSAMCGTT